ncbi:hypothetical protein [Erythrobacter sp.]|jgi:hypothetical protein|uniref:hypothetical protein n=1 Tax=Erythrobacter sp. TaxID=1042 RepID=UPI002ECBB1EA|nr:hypothetical protein [Erythrobacter sp.]
MDSLISDNLIPLILCLFTLGAVLVFALFQWRKMRSELPDDHKVRPEDKLAKPQDTPNYEPTQQSSASHGTSAQPVAQSSAAHGTPSRQD